jgi:hypothetical protein
MSTIGHAAKVRVLNPAAKQAAERAIDASARGDDIQAHHHNIDLLREHIRHQPPTLEGRERHARGERTIKLLRSVIAQAKKEHAA